MFNTVLIFKYIDFNAQLYFNFVFKAKRMGDVGFSFEVEELERYFVLCQ